MTLEQSRCVTHRTAMAIAIMGGIFGSNGFGQTVEPNVRSLMRDLGQLDDAVQDAAVKKLISKGREAIPELIGDLGQGDFRYRYGLWQVLRGLGPTSVPHLIKVIEVEENEARLRAAIEVFTGFRRNLSARAALPALVKRVTHQDRKIRSAAIDAIGVIGDPRGIPVLIRAAETENDSIVFQNAMATIENFEPTDVAKHLPRLVALATQKELDDGNREMVFVGISAARASAIPFLVAIVEDRSRSRNIRSSGIHGLGALLRSSESWLEYGAAISCLIAMLDDDDRRLRTEAAFVLGVGRSVARAALPTLLRRMAIRGPDQVDMAVAVLRISPARKEAIDLLIRLLDGKNAAHIRWTALSALGSDSSCDLFRVDTVAQYLDDRDSNVRMLTCQFLGCHASRAVQHTFKLRTLADLDPNESVRTAAANAIAAIKRNRLGK